ncbi:DUF305 domain-containing protein [Brevundimonas sp.]|uniref:DUF305 domain-containing protein n=1 Tax=Brevundimonas sp. TaxID=1871086 RepID=UPI002E14EA60|nr:DUF305 domain-containing protein [Brevundimonas sp.]
MPHLLGLAASALTLILHDPLVAGAVQDPPASPPIFNPGAPGQPSRVVTAEQAREMGRTSFIDADVQFMRHMIVHHAQAVEMVELLETRGQSPQIKALGRRIAIGQASEMALMTGWLEARGQAVEAHDLHAGHGGQDAHAGHAQHAAAPSETPLMPGMLSPAQMARLAAASGPDFDRLFLEGMIQHHQGALDMVDALLAIPDAAQDTLMSDFVSSVVGDQAAEILRMRSLLAEF